METHGMGREKCECCPTSKSFVLSGILSLDRPQVNGQEGGMVGGDACINTQNTVAEEKQQTNRRKQNNHTSSLEVPKKQPAL